MKDFKTFEGKYNEMDINELISVIKTLSEMSEVIALFKHVKPASVNKKIVRFLKHNEENLDQETIEKIKYIAKVWIDVFDNIDIVFPLQRRIYPIVAKLKKME